MSPVWSRLLLSHAAVLIAAAVVGALYDAVLIALLIGLSGILLWHLWNLYRLESWLTRGKIDELPAGSGVWPRIFARVDFVIERSRYSRKRWRRLVKELRASAKAFPDGVVIIDSNREIINYNKAARQLLGLRRKRDKGQRIDHLLRDPDFIQYLDKTDSQKKVEFQVPGDRDVWLSSRLIPYGPEQSLLLIRDITQTVKLEQMRRDFVANASHELRTPLTVISGYLDGLADDELLPGAWHGPVAEMRIQANRMANLVRDLLQLSRLESSESSPKTDAVDVTAILAAARKDALTLVEHPRLFELNLGSDRKVLGEESEIQSIVSNLVSNAVRYTPAGGSVEMSWEVDHKGGHLMIRDTGIGIPAADIPRLTERFYRTDAGRARQQSGTGLGLAIVKHALKRHDAELEIQSRPGEGSAFICHFPVDRLSAA